MTTPTQGEHAQTELAHELFAAAQLAPGEGIEDAVRRIAAALTAAPAQPAAPQGGAYAELPARRRSFFCTKCGGRECEPNTLGQAHPVCKCGYMGFAEDLDYTADQMRDFADRTHALRTKSEASREFLERMLSAMEGVIDVADRQTDEFEALRSCVVDLTLMLFKPEALRASNGQAPAGATDDQRELLEDAAFLLRKYRKLCVEIGRGDSQHLDRVEAAAVAVRALYSNPTTTAQAAPAAGAVAGQITEVMIDAATNALVLMEEGTDTSALATGEADYMRSIARATVEAALAAAPTPAAQADSQPTGAEHYNLLGLLAECRDAFPLPEIDSQLENQWMSAMGDPSEVPGYLRAVSELMQDRTARKQGGKHD